jgi:Protein of unknown function (DUF1194)
MIRPTRLLVSMLVLVGALTLNAGAGRAGSEVDLALVLAVDISNSMEPEEQELQREGFVEAFRSPLVHSAISSGALGRISVTYMEWAGSRIQYVVTPWNEIRSPEDALRFADRLDQAPIKRGPRTSISGAIDASMKLLAASEAEAARRVIDISGDGVNNQGRSVTQARDEALAQGVTINGLPIMLNRPNGSWDVQSLDEHYRDCVIGGPGAFMVPVRERHQFVEAIKTKIIREIAGWTPDARVVPARVELERRTNCDIAVSPWAN